MNEEKKEKKDFMKNVKASFKTRKFKQGAYATTLSAIVIIIVILVNLFVTELNITKDMTSDGKFTLVDETKNMVEKIKDDITIYYLTQSGEEIAEFDKIIQNYPKINSHVSVEHKDPVQYPKFASQYVDDQIGTQSFLVVNESNGRAKYISYADTLEYETDYSTGQYTVTGIQLESKINSAIQSVTNESLPKIYEVIGHGETKIGTYMSTILSESNITSDEINTLTSEEIPEDCDILFINQPQYDYTKEEAELILNYLKSGKDAIVSIDYNTPSLTHFNTILSYYGVSVAEGIVVETDTDYYRGQYASELVPTILSNEFTADFKGLKYIVSPVSSGIRLDDGVRDTITQRTILQSSGSSYSKVDINSTTVEKEDNDIDGPFALGVDVLEPVGEEETRLVVYAGKYLWNDNYLATTTFANVDLLLNTINKLTGQENVITVRPVSIEEEMLVLTETQRNRNGFIFLLLLPLIFIIPGIVVVVRRRKM